MRLAARLRRQRRKAENMKRGSVSKGRNIPAPGVLPVTAGTMKHL
jgi:hypothetical protein